MSNGRAVGAGWETKTIGIVADCCVKGGSITKNPESAPLFRQTKSCFVLISNLGAENDDRQLLGIYYGQQVVENSFMLLKKPCLASVIYLKNENRIRTLPLVLSLALMVRAILRKHLFVVKYEIIAKWLPAPARVPTTRFIPIRDYCSTANLKTEPAEEMQSSR